MASISSSNTILPLSRPSKNNTTTFRDASFSSYLNSPRPKKVDDGEIDVFSADKYFNGGVITESNTITVKENHNKTVTNLSKLDLQPKTPSIYSESSLNSQTLLLRRVQRNSSRKKSSFMSCYCCDKKSVDIENKDHGDKSMNNAYDERPITRTIKTNLDTAEITRLNKLKKIQLEDDEDEKEIRRKKSLEVFGSDEGSKRFSLEKRLKMLSWDAIPRSVEQNNASGAQSETNNDTETDASSDLFEIECLSTRDNVSGACTTLTTGYAPSEVSIDWSVVTASEDQRSTITSVARGRVGQKSASSVKQRSAAGMLSGCKSQKAVRVAEDVCITPVNKKSDVQQKMHRFSESYTPMTRFQAETKLPGHVRQSKTTSNSDILYIF